MGTSEQIETKMHKMRPSAGADPTQWDKPVRPGAIDIEVGRRGGSTIARSTPQDRPSRELKTPKKPDRENRATYAGERGPLATACTSSEDTRGHMLTL